MKLYLNFAILFVFLLIGKSNIYAQEDTKMFIFGHSLLDHRPPINPTPSDETTVPHWLFLLEQEAGNTYSAGGQYGFLPQHANLPPIAQWGYDIVPGVWESDTEPFSAADITTVLITAGNFMQWQAPDLDYPTDPGVSPVSATETIVDWINQQEPTANLYIYENWPDMAGYLSNGFPPTAAEWGSYNNYTNGAFHDWWLDYQDFLLLSRPNLNVRMIPVGPIISSVLVDHLQNSIPITELYEDDAPHGRPTIYFLASLITYMGIHEELAPSSFTVPSIIHSEVVNNYNSIVNHIWTELQAFNDSNDMSRVFYNSTTGIENISLASNCIELLPNPSNGIFEIFGTLHQYTIDILDANGAVQQNINSTASSVSIDISTLPNGLYFIRIINQNDNSIQVERMIKTN